MRNQKISVTDEPEFIEVLMGSSTGSGPIIVVVKKTFRYPNVFFYNHLCPNPFFRNIFIEKGIIIYLAQKNALVYNRQTRAHLLKPNV